MEELRIPESEIMLGVSACAVQTEGDDKRNTWYEWYRKGYIKDGSSPDEACGFYENYKREVDLMADMGITRFRLGVSWSRIEPARGVFNNGVIKHYREILEYIASKGIVPMLTLHSFADPLWFMELGGFEDDGCVGIYLHYVKKAVESFGDLVKDFITMNEPNTYAINGYFYGCFPPGKQSYKTYRKVLTNMARCHMSAYELIHSTAQELGYSPVRVSCSIAAIYHEPKDPRSGYQRRAAAWLDSFGYLSFAKAVLAGTAARPVKKLGMPKGCYADFIAMNYQYGTMVTGYEERPAPEGFPVSDLGNAICPEGLVKCARDLTSVADLPVIVTENGVCDNEDFFRIRYIYEHLRAMAGSSVYFEGYYYRSFTDSFEFLEGNFARYGLVHTDFDTGEMSVKRSGEFYSDVIRNNGVTEEMTLRYAGTYYHDITGKILEGIDEVYTDREKFLKSENGSGVITSVSAYAADPEGYDEFSIREQKGLNARTVIPADESLPQLGPTGEDGAAPDMPAPPEREDMYLSLDVILGRIPETAPEEVRPEERSGEEIPEEAPTEDPPREGTGEEAPQVDPPQEGNGEEAPPEDPPKEETGEELPSEDQLKEDIKNDELPPQDTSPEGSAEELAEGAEDTESAVPDENVPGSPDETPLTEDTDGEEPITVEGEENEEVCGTDALDRILGR